jgi:hypothetical protein
MANKDMLRERINRTLTEFGGGRGDAYDMVRGLGLPTFSEFEQAIAPLLKRVTANKRRTLLEELYVVTAKKLMRQGGPRAMEYMTKDWRKRRKLLGRTQAHIRKARKSVSTAEATFPRLLPSSFDFSEIIKRLREFETDLAERQQTLATLVPPSFKTKTEKRITPPSAGPFSWPKHKAIQQWFIKALDKCLPQPLTGIRSRFPRNDVIQKVLKVSGDTVSIRSILRVRKLRNIPPMGAKKK